MAAAPRVCTVLIGRRRIRENCVLPSNLMVGGSDCGTAQGVALVVPCFNEAARLDVRRFRSYLAEEQATRLIFVDDGSTDETACVLKQLADGYPDRITILGSRPNRGKAEAVRLGLNHALHAFELEVAGYWDADLATPLESANRFVCVLNERPGIEMVFGSRVKLLGRYVERRPARHYLGRVFATVVSQMLHLPIYDTQCGAKLFRVTPVFRQVLEQAFLSKWVFDVEIIARFMKLYGNDPKRLEEIIYEYPLEAWVDIPGSKVRPKDFLTAFQDLVRIKRRYLSGN